MTEGEPRLPFELLRLAKEGLEQRGFFFFPIEKELTEARVTGPLVHRLRTHIKKRGLAKLGGRTIITFSGYETDTREVYEVSEIRAYFAKLDDELPELPALPAFLPELRFNGPGLYLLLLGEVEMAIPHPEEAIYDVHVKGADRLIHQALRRIQQAASRHHLSPAQGQRIERTFVEGATYRQP